MSPHVESPPLPAATFTRCPQLLHIISSSSVCSMIDHTFAPDPPYHRPRQRRACRFSTSGVRLAQLLCRTRQQLHNRPARTRFRHTAHSLNPTRPDPTRPITNSLSFFLSFLLFISRPEYNILRRGAKSQGAYLRCDTGIWRKGLRKPM